MAQRQRVSRGEAVTAEKWNALVDSIERLEDVVRAGFVGDGLPMVVRGRVSAVAGLTDVPNSVGPISSVTYSIKFLGSTAADMTGVIPWLGRPVAPSGGGSATLIVAAAVNDPVLVVRMPDGTGGFANYCVVAERLYVQVCPA